MFRGDVALGACPDVEEDGRSSDPASEASFQPSGSITQVKVVDAPVGARLSLWRSGGDEVETSTTDVVESLVFQDVEPGSGYVVEENDDGKLQRSAPFTMLDATDTPPQSLYDGQDLVGGSDRCQASRVRDRYRMDE